jgi:hypothetical protein
MGKGVAAGGEGLSHKFAGQVIWKSDEAIVVMKRANKIGWCRWRSAWSEGPSVARNCEWRPRGRDSVPEYNRRFKTCKRR